MWHKTFEDRLGAWNQLRDRVTLLPADQALFEINSWWFNTPWTAYHLHWDDRPTWPDPWQLLSDNLFCGLARGLGIVYTCALINRVDLHDAVLIETDSDNLVLIDQGKYILNWDPDQIVNISLGTINSRRRVSQEQIKQKIR